MNDSTSELAIKTLIARYFDAVNRYDDSYTCANGEWLIQSRRYHKLHEAQTGAKEVHTPYPAN